MVERESGSAAKRGYNSPQWKRLRRMVIRRDPCCVLCLKQGRVTASTDADHIIPKDKGGKDSLDNLQGLCSSCHGKKTRAENS